MKPREIILRGSVTCTRLFFAAAVALFFFCLHTAARFSKPGSCRYH